MPAKTQFVRVSTELPLQAERAYELAGLVSVFSYVVSPLMSITLTPEQELLATSGEFPLGETFEIRLKLLKFIPGWLHTLTLVRAGELADGSYELYTNERSIVTPVWNHHLTFEPAGRAECHYTDEIEIEGGLLGTLSKPLVAAFFKYRQWRWRGLTRAIA